jgi:hypothetical protein
LNGKSLDLFSVCRNLRAGCSKNEKENKVKKWLEEIEDDRPLRELITIII